MDYEPIIDKISRSAGKTLQIGFVSSNNVLQMKRDEGLSELRSLSREFVNLIRQGQYHLRSRLSSHVSSFTPVTVPNL